MWISVIGSVLLAIIRGEEEQEGNKRKALGLSDENQLDFNFLVGKPGDFLVPIQIWADGAGIWRIVGWEDLKDALARLRGKTFFSQELLKEMNIDTWTEQDLKDTTGPLVDAYLYLDDRDHGHRSSAILLVERENFSENIERIDIVLMHGRREDDKSMVRIRSFVFSNGWPCDDISQTIEKGMVPDKMLETRNQILEGKQGVEDTLSEAFDRVDRKIGLWASDYIELRNEFSLLQGLLQEKDNVESMNLGDEEAMSNFRDSSHDEEIEQVEEELENFAESPTFERWRESRISDINEQIREVHREIDRISKDEADRLDQALLFDMELDRQVDRSNDSVHEWRITTEGAGRYSDEIDTLLLKWDREGRYWYDFDQASLRFVPERPGAFEALYAAGYIETESERKKRIGETVWRFPGGLSGTWEVNHILDRFTPDGTEPLFVFLKIAADHGLLSPYAQKKYEKLLLLWRDENLEELLEKHHIFKNQE